jgi:hypothetical protein
MATDTNKTPEATMASTTLKARPQVYRRESLARMSAAQQRKGWLCRAEVAFDAVPRIGSSRPTHVPAGAWIVVLPVDAGRLEREGLAKLARCWDRKW